MKDSLQCLFIVEFKFIFNTLYCSHRVDWKGTCQNSWSGVTYVVSQHTARKRDRAHKRGKKRITQLVNKSRPCFLFQLDTIVIYEAKLKRYILTAVDHATKLGYARMYRNKSSRSAADFLYRLRHLVGQPIENLQTDNGSEFAREFEKASTKLEIKRYFSRVRTPKDNPEIERFNQTLQYEWLYDSNLSLDPEELNPYLTEWLVEYNYNRPHQSLAYLTPIEYIENELAKIRSPLLPMWSARTRRCSFRAHMLFYL